MSVPFTLPDPSTERELFALVTRERLARDTADWELLEALYWPGSIVRVTWFTGTIEDFVAVSRDQQKRGRGGSFHVIQPLRSQVEGPRALVESRGQIRLRPTIDGVQCDVVNFGRFFSRAECREGVWRLASFDSIYGKDRIDPVDPAATLALDADLLARGRSSYQYLAYLNRKGGFVVPDDLPGDDDPRAVTEFILDALEWMREQG
jgi:hypothetical protein